MSYYRMDTLPNATQSGGVSHLPYNIINSGEALDTLLKRCVGATGLHHYGYLAKIFFRRYTRRHGDDEHLSNRQAKHSNNLETIAQQRITMTLPLKCPLCNASHEKQNVVTPHVYGGRSGQAFYRCGHCDVCYLFPGLTSEEEKQFYAAEFSSFMGGRAGAAAGWSDPARHVEANQWMASRRMKYLGSRLPAAGRVLEIGCSSAFMLYPLIERGLECVGVEPSGAFGEYVRSRGIDCYDSTDELVSANRYPDGFDLVMHSFVLEHISAPGAFLRQQIDLLRPVGKPRLKYRIRPIHY
ncbi:MAG: methyltransferase domain-containing protein [Burkholderiaceae bacterium]|nr:methyltransferase domain-containing protein [Burkholderiaceae bacterium]